MRALVMTSGLKQVLLALLMVGAVSDSARPVLLEERFTRLAEAPTLVIPASTGPHF